MLARNLSAVSEPEKLVELVGVLATGINFGIVEGEAGTRLFPSALVLQMLYGFV